MATRLHSFAHKSGLVFYLDTSAVMPLALKEAGTLNSTERGRHNSVTAFVEQARRASSRTVSSVLSLEEIAARTRNEMQRTTLQQVKAASWRDYERVSPAAAATDRKTIQAHVLKMLQHAADGLGNAGVSIEQPIVADAHKSGQQVRKAHREFLRLYEDIDSMDALHIAVGGMLGCKHFISFDGAWTKITEIEVLS